MDGLWLARFTTSAAHGRGLVDVHGGEFLGGDLSHIYQGEWREDGPSVYARVRVEPSPEEEKAPAEAAGEGPFLMTLRGSLTAKSACLHGHPDERPELLIEVALERAA